MALVKRLIVTATIVLAIMGASIGYLVAETCTNWQERYKRLLYSELMMMSPVIYTPEMREEIIGERPPACDLPSEALSKQDIKRFRIQGVGPNEFLEEKRAAYRRLQDS